MISAWGVQGGLDDVEKALLKPKIKITTTRGPSGSTYPKIPKEPMKKPSKGLLIGTGIAAAGLGAYGIAQNRKRPQ